MIPEIRIQEMKISAVGESGDMSDLSYWALLRSKMQNRLSTGNNYQDLIPTVFRGITTEITKAEIGRDPSGISKPTMGAQSSLVDHKLTQ